MIVVAARDDIKILWREDEKEGGGEVSLRRCESQEGGGWGERCEWRWGSGMSCVDAEKRGQQETFLFAG